MVKISVSRDRCEGHGLCHGIAPELFVLDDDGLVEVTTKGQSVPADLEERAAQAVHTCPMGALRLERT